MVLPLLLAALPLLGALGPTGPPGPGPSVHPLAGDREFDRRLEAAGDDVHELWELVLWCEDTDREKQARTVLRQIVRAHPNHSRARQRLGHVQHEGEWFESERDLERHLEELEEERAREQGFVRYRGQWVHPEHVPLLRKGLVRGPLGRWLTKEEQRNLAEGWVLQDLVWIPPDEVANVGQGLWKCGEKWLSLEEADLYHTRLERPWIVPTETLTLRTSCPRATAEKAIVQMEAAYEEMVRLWGKAPARPLRVLLGQSSDQTTTFVGGQYRAPYDGRELLGTLRATFAEGFRDDERWLGAGTSFWDGSSEGHARYGVHDSRMALGLAFSDALDPSPDAVARLERKGWSEDFPAEYWEEKQAPPWWFWGTACYAARYYGDRTRAGGDPWWARAWSIENLRLAGGLPSLDPVWEFEIGRGNLDGPRIVNAAGLVVAFVADGECDPVRELHREIVEHVRGGKDPGKIFDQLRKTIDEHEDDLRTFAGL